MTHPSDHRTLPLTGAQTGIWFAQRLDPENPIFNLGQYLRIAGAVDGELLRRAFERALSEIDAVHARFVERDGEPVQVLGDDPSWTWDVLDLRDRDDPEGDAREWMERDMERRTDLAADPLVTVRLLRVQDDVFVCYQRVHHIAMDGYGDGLVLARVAQVYDALAAGDDVPDGFFRPLAELVEEDRAYRSSERYDEDRAFWREELADRAEPVGLAPPPQAMSRRMRRSGRSVAPDAADALRATAEDADVRLSSLIVASFAAYLHRSTGARDVVVGLPVTGRRGAVAKTTPSMMSNVVPLRLGLRPDIGLCDLAREVSERIRAILPHQRVGTDQMLRDLELPASTRLAGPALNIIPEMGTLTFAGRPSSIHNLAVGPIDDLSVVVMGDVDGRGLRINLEANAALYEQDELDAHLERFANVLRGVVADPRTPIGSLRVATDEDARAARAHAPGTTSAPPRRTLPELFAAQAVRSPDAVALVAHDGRLRFSELDARADRLAHVLRDRGIGVGDVVGVALPRCLSMPVALLAVVKAGAVYLPVDPTLPAGRIASVVEDADPAVVVSDRATAAVLPDGTTVMALDDPAVAEAVEEAPATPLTNELRESLVGPGDAAYVVFTSGSTGRPKGVVVEHAALVNLYAQHQREVFGPATAENGGRLRVAHSTATSFDAAWDPILWMVAGHELHLVDDDTRHDAQALVAYVREQGIGAVETTPSFARELIAQGLLGHPDEDGVRVLALGGEEVDAALWDDLADREGLMAFNFFGPTETTVDAVTARIEHGVGRIIGRPRRNVRAYVLDIGLDPAPVGVTGELYLAGASLARGYLGRPGQTAERFVADPWGSAGERMYRTGDLARWRPDSSLEFAGRVDDQVKIRGFRVELTEIQAVVAEHPDVRTAAVVVREDAPGVQRLVAYVVPTDGEGTARGDGAAPDADPMAGAGVRVDAAADRAIDPAALRAHAATRLPEYMVPSGWVALDELPLTPNGKLDQSRLPRPEASDTGATGADARPPASAQEEHLAGLFAETLGLPQVGVDDDFFVLGGHSLLATRLISRIRSELGAELPVRALFETPTVAGLADRLEGAERARPPLRRRERPERLPLSFAQRRLWFLNRLEPGSSAYNIPAVLRLRGALDVDALRAAVADLVRRHETLRTSFPEDEDGRPHQAIADPETVRSVLTTEQVAPDDVDGRLREIARGGFDLAADLPIRVVLLRTAEDDHRLVLLLHHIAGDGWSMGPLARDLAVAYAARRDGAAPDWAPLPVQYADYALWQAETLGDEDDEQSPVARQIAHWEAVLADLPEELELPTDRPRPARAGDDVDAVPVRLAPEATGALDALARERGASVFMVLQAGLAALLSRLGAGPDVPIGSPIAGRTDEALDELVGFFVNTLVLRTDVSGDPTFGELVDRVRETDLDAYANQDVPFERLVEALAPERSLARHPLFQVLLAFQNAPAAELVLPGLDVELQQGGLDTGAKFDLSLDLGETSEDDGRSAITGTLAFRTDLFDRTTVEAVVDRLQRVLTAAAADPSLRVADLPVLHPDEERALQAEHRAAELPAAPSIVEVLAATVRERPDDVALRDDERTWTFAELNDESARLARGLARRAVAGRTVGVALPRTGDGTVALLAVLRARGAYLPLDLEHPDARLAAILDDAQPALVLVRDEDRGRLPDGTTALAPATAALDAGDLADPASTDADTPAEPAPTDAGDLADPAPTDAAYVLFTSGSTGRPKGVVVEHGSLARLLQGHRGGLIDPAAERAGRRLRVAHTTAVSFDAAWDPILWMVAGHELRLVSDADRRDPEALIALVADERIDVLETTPTYAEHLLGEGLTAGSTGPSLLLLGGEAVPATLWTTLRERPDLVAVNLYGPTEATVDALTASVDEADVPVVGRPVDGLRTRILDARLRPVPVGAAGELYLAGDGVARAYLRRPDLTAERFVADPFGTPGGRMYRTGDLARRRRDGAIEFRGRTDDQVKVRGFRVELGEVEAALLADPAVGRAAVVVRRDAAGAAQLAAYVVPVDRDAVLDPDVARSRAADRLAAYMVPATFTLLEDLPLTPNGKLDRRALPAPQAAAAGRDPAGPVEEALARVFATVLGVDRVGADDDFFALGGHSLLATRLVSAVRDELDAELPVRALFEAPTVASLAAQVQTAGAARPGITPIADDGPIPLSHAQHRLWFLSRLDDSTAAYHLPLAVRLRGPLDADALERAIDDLVARHEPLRTVLPEHEDGARQEVLPAEPSPVPLRRSDLDGHDLGALLRRLASVSFDLATGPPLRAHLVRVADDEHVLLLVLHHVAADGWSMGPLGRDLSAAYAARRQGRAPELPGLPVRYADYAAWQRRVLGDESDPDSALSRQLAHWRERLADLPAEIDLPADRPRPAESTGHGDEVRFVMDADVHRDVLAVARDRGASAFMVLQAALAVLLTRLGAGTDVAVGSPIAGRTDAALEELVGFFVNTLVLRTDTSGDPAFADLVDRVRDVDLDAYAHQDVPFERLVEELRPERSLSRHPLFQVMLTLGTGDAASVAPELPGLRAEPVELAVGVAKFDLSFTLTERDDDGPAGLDGVLEYSTDLFDRGTAERLVDRLVTVVSALGAEPERRIGSVDLLSDDERRAVLEEFNAVGVSATPADALHDETVLDAFERHASSHPDDIALVDGSGRRSFAELDGRADAIAHALAGRGDGVLGRSVGVALPRTGDWVAAALGVMKARGVLLPLDLAHPDDRLAAIVRDADPALVLTAPEAEGRLPDGPPRLAVDDIAATADAPPTPTELGGPRSSCDAAYVLFTSGSTGRPKGVVVEHRGLVDLLAHHRERLFAPAVRRAGRDRLRVAHTTALSFDAAWDPILWMIGGHELHLIDEETRHDPTALVAAVADRRLDVLETTPSYVEALLDLGLLDAEHAPVLVALGGEAVHADLWERLRGAPRTDAVNLYGPTETTVDAVVARLDEHERPVIGHPVGGTWAYVLDGSLQPQPPGVPGELYLAGCGVARAYLGRADLTAERFVADPFGPAGARMYRTGDRARWLADGALEFGGRSDDQVKIRGFRVETGEVREALVEQDGVGSAAVVTQDDPSGAAALVAYVVPTDGAALDADELRAALARRLPDYMVPRSIGVLDALPLTANGKLDRRALPEPARPTGGAAPRTPREVALCDVFASVLGVPHVGTDESFFDLGGHSLLAARLCARIGEELDVDLPIRALFQTPTVAGLAARLGDDDAPADDDRSEGLRVLLPLRPEGDRAPLFCVHPASGVAWSYAAILGLVPDGVPVYGLQSRGLVPGERQPADLDALVDDLVQEVRSVQPEGPYRLLGWSLGGTLAHRIAVRLREQDEEVGLLALLDAFPSPALIEPPGEDEEAQVLAAYLHAHDGGGTTGSGSLTAGSAVEHLRRTRSPLADLDDAQVLALARAFVGQARMVRAAPVPTFDGDLLFVSATEEPTGEADPGERWRPHVDGAVHHFPAPVRHEDLLGPKALAVLGPALQDVLRPAADDDAPTPTPTPTGDLS